MIVEMNFFLSLSIIYLFRCMMYSLGQLGRSGSRRFNLNEKSLVLLLVVVTIITIFIILFNLPSEINAINKANIGRVFIPDSIERDKPHHIHDNDHQHPAPPMNRGDDNNQHRPGDVDNRNQNNNNNNKEPGEKEGEGGDENENSYRLKKVKEVNHFFISDRMNAN